MMYQVIVSTFLHQGAYGIKLFPTIFFKATGFDPGRSLYPSLMFAGNARSLPRVERLKSAQLGQAQTLGWAGKDCQDQRL